LVRRVIEHVRPGGCGTRQIVGSPACIVRRRGPAIADRLPVVMELEQRLDQLIFGRNGCPGQPRLYSPAVRGSIKPRPDLCIHRLFTRKRTMRRTSESWSKNLSGITHFVSPLPAPDGVGNDGTLCQSLVFIVPSNSVSG